MIIARHAALFGVLVTACSGGMPDQDAGFDASADLDGAGVPLDASQMPQDSGVEQCDTTGAMRTASCGNCGEAAEQCAEGVWTRVSDCLDQGECAPGSVDMQTLPMCQVQQRLCDEQCHWRDWNTTTPAGDCDSGETRLSASAECGAGLQPQRCTAACVWQNDGACDDGCGSTARNTPEWRREVCIPAGPFTRGFVGDPNAEPVGEVTLSAFYIDAYPVTNRAYAECIAASACTPSGRYEGQMSLDDPTRLDYPVQAISYDQAVAFCGWDGGRALPTQAQWEKAARGPAPRAQRWVWDGDAYRCDLVQASSCGWTPPTDNLAPDAYNGLPGSRSYYGTFLQYGGMIEMVSDWFQTDWYEDPASFDPDPTGPSSGARRTTVGTIRAGTGPSTGLSGRWESYGVAAMQGFRCVRIPTAR